MENAELSESRIVTDALNQRPQPARLILGEEHPGHIVVEFQPEWRPEWAQLVGLPSDAVRPSASLLSHNATQSTLIIRPVVTSLSLRFLKPKHAPITDIALEDWYEPLPRTEQEVRGMLEELPAGFITSPDFGLGIEKEYQPILEALRQLRGVDCLVLTRRRETGRDENLFYLTYDDYNDIRRAMHRVTARYRAEARIDRKVIAHNEILTALDPNSFPAAVRPYAPGTIFKLLSRRGEIPSKLSGDDGRVLVETLEAATPSLAKEHPGRLFALGETVERASLEAIIARFEALLAQGGSEAQWQKLLDQNPFILTLVFGYPIVQLASQGAVGGWRLSRDGSKVADFVVKNKLTQSIAIVELKTPKTDLTMGDYRKGVPGISTKLTGAVMQVLDQRLKLQKSLSLLKEEDESLRSAEAFGIDCIVIAGSTPVDRAAVKSFELFRGGLRDVRVFTFDELLEKMKALLAVLTAEQSAERPRPENGMRS